MAPKTDKTGTVTGAKLNQSSRGKKGGLTGSKRVTGEKKAETSNLPTSDPEVSAADSNARAKLAGIINGTNQVIGGTGEAIRYVSQVAKTLAGVDTNPATITDGTLDTAGILAKADAEIDESIGKLEHAEATRRNIVIAQQRNYVDVAINNTKLKQDIATLDIEQSRLIGLLINGKTERVHNERKAVDFHRAVTARDTNISKLEEDRELLTQQRIKTEGTQNQTELISEQEQLKVQKLREEVEKQRYEIENLNYEKEKIKHEVKAKFLAGF